MKQRIVFVFLFSLVIKLSFAGDVQKAFKYLTSGDYSNAKKFLSEALKDEPENVAVNYGLAKYYSAKDNKEYALDSAIVYIVRASKKLPLNPEDKQSKKFAELGVRDYTVQTLQKTINFQAYSAAEVTNTVESYQHFIDHYTDTVFLEQATNFRNQKAYIRAMAQNSYEAMAEFIKLYPQATEAKEAKARYEKLLYEQITADGTFQSFRKYLDTYPNGAYVADAQKNFNEKVLAYYNSKHSIAAYLEFERSYKTHPSFNAIQDSIYLLATKDGTIDAYRNFVGNYPQNKNYSDAWEQLYLLSTANATQNEYLAFIQTFPSAPNKEAVYKDIELAAKDLTPLEQDGKWGYVTKSDSGTLTVAIPFQYEEAFEFSNGLAVASSSPCNNRCQYYYITKANQRAFDANFNYAGDFAQGAAIVGLGNCEEDSCKYGLIDRRGRFVIPPVYDELNEPTEDLFLVAQNDRYGFVNKKGETIVTLKYTDALPFQQGMAAVALDSNWFFIDKTGKQAFIVRFRNVSSFADSLCAATTDGNLWGYIDMTGNFVIQPLYESAEDFSNGFGIISKREKDPRNKGMYISQRYRIDKNGKVLEKLTAPKTDKKKSKRKGKR